MNVACHLCGQPVDTRRNVYRRVHGWEHKAAAQSRRGGSDIVLRELTDEWAHAVCIARVRAGLNVGQEALL